MARKVRIPLDERLPKGWRDYWSDYSILRGGSLSDKTKVGGLFAHEIGQLHEGVEIVVYVIRGT